MRNRLLIGISLLASCTFAGTGTVAAQADRSLPSVANVCDLGRRSANPSHDSLDTLRGLIARRIACQNTLLPSVEAALQSLQEDHESSESLASAVEALIFVEADMLALQQWAVSTDTTLEILDASLGAVALGVETLDAALESVADDELLADVDLQNILQRQQQTLQMMSNISKMLHDTAAAIIRNLK